jgi:cytochrome c oxidase subunit 2
VDGPTILRGAGAEGRDIAGLWWVMFGLAALVYVAVAGLVVYALLRRRESRLRDDSFVVFGGVVAPAVILLVLAAVTVRTTASVRAAERGALRVEVVGRRWFWDVEYRDARVRGANEVRVPVGRPVDIALKSTDVVHSFWVPDVAGKLDLVPGRTNHLRLRVRKAGTYVGECAEYCGLQHANMRFALIAMPAVEFDRWLARRSAVVPAPSSEDEARGEAVFARESCGGCHTIAGTVAHGVAGPDLSDLGERRWLGALTIPNTRARLADWILNPQRAKRGNVMPPTQLSGDDLRALVAYLESLK